MVATAISFGDHSVMERDRISASESYGRVLENECCFPDVLCDGCDEPAIFLCQFNGHVVPCTSCLYRKWVEDVSTDQFGILVILVLCCLKGCCTWLGCYAASMWDSA